MEEHILITTDFGNVISYEDDGELDICFQTEKGDIIDLFMIKIGDNCLREFLYGDVFDEDYTEHCTITKDDINKSCMNE